jgi:uncharacterized protein (TIGR02594 family)
MSRFSTQQFKGLEPSIHEEKDSASPSEFFPADESPSSIVELLTDLNEDADWVRVQRQEMIGGLVLTGWMLRGHLGAALGQPTVMPITERQLVHACVRQELAAPATGDPAHPIQADYLIALAWLESEGLTRLGRRMPLIDTIGPYQFSPKAWSELAGTAMLPPTADRFNSLDQIIAAAAVARRDWEAFSALASPAGGTAADGPFIPSFLNLFQAWLIGVPAAQEVDRANAAGAPASLIRPIIDRHHSEDSVELVAARADYLPDGSVAGFIRTTTEKLNGALKKAGELLVEHMPEFALPGGGTAAPWMEIAQRELESWTTKLLVESSAEGKERVRAYFAATDHGISDTDPWCGAFIAFCLKESGNPRAVSSVIPGAALADNWKRWGDIALHASVTDNIGGLRRGAVVILGPDVNTGSSGHVTFFTGNRAGADRIVCVGGNQSDRVKESNYLISSIAAVRFLDVGDPEALPGEVVTADVVRFRPMLDFIANHEGTANQDGRGYNTSLGFGRFIGGEKQLTTMSLDQIDELQTKMLNNPDNNLNSSALGRYQIVRTTLRRLKEHLRLSGSVLFSEHLQDQLGVTLIKGRGPNVEGLRNEWASLRTVGANEILEAFNEVGV